MTVRLVLIIMLLMPGVASAATVYINPACQVSGDGTTGAQCALSDGAPGPLRSWADVVWADGTVYAQKAGTVFHGQVEITASGASNHSRIVLTSYGPGPRAAIDGHGQQFGLFVRGAQAHITIANLEIYGVDTNTGNRFLMRLGNGTGQEASDIIVQDVILHGAVDPGGGNEADGIWGYCVDCTFDRVWIYDIPSDGIWLANVGHFTLRDSVIERVATSGRATGDCVQLGGTASALTVLRNKLDHSSTESKQAFGDFTTGATRAIVEDNTFLMATLGDQASNSKTVVISQTNLLFRRNRVIGGDWGLSFSGSGHIYDNEIRGARTNAWVAAGEGTVVTASGNVFDGGAVGLNLSRNGTLYLSQNILTNFGVAIQRGGSVRVIDDRNVFWQNTTNALWFAPAETNFYVDPFTVDHMRVE